MRIRFADPAVNRPQDVLIRKNEVLMTIANYQMGTNPYTKEGDVQYQILEMLFRTIEDMEGIPVKEDR